MCTTFSPRVYMNIDSQRLDALSESIKCTITFKRNNGGDNLRNMHGDRLWYQPCMASSSSTVHMVLYSEEIHGCGSTWTLWQTSDTNFAVKMKSHAALHHYMHGAWMHDGKLAPCGQLKAWDTKCFATNTIEQYGWVCIHQCPIAMSVFHLPVQKEVILPQVILTGL